MEGGLGGLEEKNVGVGGATRSDRLVLSCVCEVGAAGGGSALA